MADPALMLSQMGTNLKQGIGGIGRNKMDMAALALQDKQLAHNMGRQKAADERMAAMDALKMPMLEAQAADAKDDLDWRNEPVTIQSLFPDHQKMLKGLRDPDWEPEMVSMVGGQKKAQPYPTLFDEVQKTLGGRFDTDQGSKTYGRLLKEDGSVMTNAEAGRHAPRIAELSVLYSDPMRDRRDAEERIMEQLEAHKAGRGNPNISLATMKEALEEIDRVENSPQMQKQLYEHRLTVLGRLSGKRARKEEARVQGIIDGLNKQIGTLDDREFQLNKMNKQEDRKDRREWIKAGRKKDKESKLGGVLRHTNGMSAATAQDVKRLWESMVPKVQVNDFSDPQPLPMTPENMKEYGFTFIPSGTDPNTAAGATAPGVDAGGPSGKFKVGAPGQGPQRQPEASPALAPSPALDGAGHVVVNGQAYQPDQDGVVTIDGQRFQVRTKGGGQTQQAKVPRPQPVAAREQAPDLSQMFVDDNGIVWEKRMINGQVQPVRVATPERPEIRMGNRRYPNPKYAEYEQLVNAIQTQGGRLDQTAR